MGKTKLNVLVVIVVILSLMLAGCSNPNNSTEMILEESKIVDISTIVSNEDERTYLEVMAITSIALTDGLERFENLRDNIQYTDEWKKEIGDVSMAISDLVAEIDNLDAQP